MKFVGVRSHIKLPFLTLGKNIWHFYKNTSFASHFYKEGILLFPKFIKWQFYHPSTLHTQSQHHTFKKKMVLSNCKLPPYHPFSCSLQAPRPICWVGLTPILDSRMGFKCPTSTSYHPGHSGWFRDAHMTHLRPIKQEDSTPGLRVQK